MRFPKKHTGESGIFKQRPLVVPHTNTLYLDFQKVMEFCQIRLMCGNMFEKYLLNTIIKKKKLLLCFIDLEKAFDKLERKYFTKT